MTSAAGCPRRSVRFPSSLQILSFLDIEAAGPSYSVPQLTRALTQAGAPSRLLYVGNVPPNVPQNVDLARFDHDFGRIPVAKGLFLSRGLAAELDRSAPKVDLLHAHGLWLMPNIYPAWAARKTGKPLVVSPRGTLSAVALEFSPLKKRLFWAAFQGRALRDASLLHATSQQEYADIRAKGFRQPVAIIPNGIDLEPAGRIAARGSRRTLLYLGRLHPIKGLEALIDAWATLERDFPDWDLRIVGPGSQAYVRQLARTIEASRLQRVALVGACYGTEKRQEYAGSDLFVLPSRSENFGMTVAEALAQAVPVVTTTGTPWEGVVEKDCGWWVEPAVECLTEALRQAMARPVVELRRMGRNGERWVEERFSWRMVAKEMAEAYAWLCGNGEKPPTVVVD